MSCASAPEQATAPEQCRQQCRVLGVARVQQMLEQSPPPSWRQEAERWLEEQALRSAQLTQWGVLAGIALALVGIVLVVAFFW
ncbi:hypothetical protein KHF85_17500 [Xanthomonas translucens pv. graminis]|uniref:hypothetical protein n=1 Tax=Xanthomonas graminis TaxID=3390026 RepID=UPI002540A816|nr:hypothetical protein [Xanthomonas translucens]WIH04551.1 hypothetical protein KHF85_17500 [Xanthomonas translucens pv. graminis]